MAKPKYLLNVGQIPAREGVWLVIQEGTTGRALAKFTSPAAADEFLAIMRVGGIGPGEDA